MSKTSFLIYNSIYSPIKDLSDSDFGKLWKAIFEYQINGLIPSLEGGSQIAFMFIKELLDRDSEKYKSIVERNKNNGLMGGRPKTQTNPENPVGFLETQNNPKKPKKALSDTDTDTDKESKKEVSIDRHTYQEIPDWLKPFENDWNDFVKFRGKKFTRRAKELAIMELHKLMQQGNSPDKVIQQSIMRGYSGLFPIKSQNNQQSLSISKNPNRKVLL